MPLHVLRDSVKSAAQRESLPRTKFGAVIQLVKLAALAGLVIAAMIVPATTFVGVSAKKVSGDVMNLPISLKELDNPQTTRLYAADGSRMAFFFQENRQDVPLEKISTTMTQAIIAIEDNRFYEHGALDIQGTARALFNNATSGNLQGGSSITQQLAKLTVLQSAGTDTDRKAATEISLARKVRELKIAMNLEEMYTKDEILAKYLNIANFGDGAYGINAAAYRFFSVSPADLSVKQAATLAGLVRNPTGYNPRKNPERAIARRNTVLAVLADQGKISKADAEKFQAEPLGLKITKFPNGCVSSEASWSCEYIRQYLLQDKDLGKTVADRKALLERGGLTIKANIDIGMQRAANEAVHSYVAPKDNAIGALALVEPGTGKVKGLAQSRPMGDNVKKGETFLNFVVPEKYGDAMGFQAGSTFKMFTAAAALNAGFPPSTTFNSPPSMVIPAGSYFNCNGESTAQWKVKNSTKSGVMQLTNGFPLSVNTYFAQLEKAVGLCETVKMAQKFGIVIPPDTPGYSVVTGPFTLGTMNVSPLDMAAAYATAASGGMYCAPLPVSEILDRNGNLIKKYEPKCKRAIPEEAANQINQILTAVQLPGGYGAGAGATLNIPSAAKTGTTTSGKSVWFTGYTPELVTASMLAGVTDKGLPRSLEGVTIKGKGRIGVASGSSLASPMWKAAMGKIQDSLAPAPFDPAPPHAYWAMRAAEYAADNPDAHSVLAGTNRYNR